MIPLQIGSKTIARMSRFPTFPLQFPQKPSARLAPRLLASAPRGRAVRRTPAAPHLDRRWCRPPPLCRRRGRTRPRCGAPGGCRCACGGAGRGRSASCTPSTGPTSTTSRWLQHGDTTVNNNNNNNNMFKRTRSTFTYQIRARKKKKKKKKTCLTSQNTNWPFDVLRVYNECSYINLCRSGYFYNTQLVVRRAGMWPSSRSAEKPANTPVTSVAADHVHFDVQNPTAYSIAWSREASVNTRGATSK